MEADDRLIQALDQYETLIFSICYQMTKNYFDAQDLTQETFLAYYRSLSDFDGKNEKGYLTKIAANKCLDHLRRSERRTAPTEFPELEVHIPPQPPPEQEVLDRLVQEKLLLLCRSLKPPYDQVAEAHFCRNMTAREIAAQQRRRQKTVQTQIARAKKMLQQLWKEEDWL